MPSLLTKLLVVAVLAATALTQQREQDAIYRDASLLPKLRVVCSDQHFGRVEDLIVEIPSGRLTGAVVSMMHDGESRTVFVPYADLAYEPRSNLLNLANCLQQEERYGPFDPSTVKLTTKVPAGGGEALPVGTIKLSALLGCSLALQQGGVGSVQGCTLELTSGHVAFADAAVGKERAGDADLHPVPWSALRLTAADSAEGPSLALALARTDASLRATPNLLMIIVQNPLHRARVYATFEVPRPVFERG